MSPWLEKWGQESFILMACLCADGNNPVESEKLIMQKRTGGRIVIWKPPKELLKLFRLFTPNIPYPNRDIYYIIMILSCPIIASSPIGSLSPIISISVSSLVVYYPSTQAQQQQGIFYFLNMEPLTIFLAFLCYTDRAMRKQNWVS